MPPEASPEILRRIAACGAELADLKRIGDPRGPDVVASRLFRDGWAALIAGLDAETVAVHVTAAALAAARLGAIDFQVLSSLGLSANEAHDVLHRSLDEFAGDCLADAIKPMLRARLGAILDVSAKLPSFVEALIRQPRAGATCPGKPRIMLEPQEGHGDHCLIVAVLGVMLAPYYGADSRTVFLAAMAHHLHNAALPDSGFAGEILLGDHLEPVMKRLFDQALATLPDRLSEQTRTALSLIQDAAHPVGRAFHAADVIDRVQEMRHFAKVAAFTTDQALDDLELVHAGPVQAFHQQVLRDAGLP